MTNKEQPSILGADFYVKSAARAALIDGNTAELNRQIIKAEQLRQERKDNLRWRIGPQNPSSRQT